ncbi:MAG: hypothetical protein OXF93_11450 [Acidobacteria bacterium]|nr:hypothetical protein [Acidobacteriota bacterium]
MTGEERQQIVQAIEIALAGLTANDEQPASIPTPEEFAMMASQAVDAEIARRLDAIKRWFRSAWGRVVALVTALAILAGLAASVIKIWEFLQS